jgi:Temperature dependent protein affecting M2 dsRNA replication
MTIESDAIDRQGVQLDFKTSCLDFDLSQFNTYMRSLKFLMKSNFQTIMYRMYRNGRADIKLYQEALSMQSFNKEGNNLFGYVIKAILSAEEGSQILKEPWTAIDSMFTPAEYKEALLKACHLWKHVLYIHEISTQLSGASGGVSNKLSEQFKMAHEFLLKKMQSMKENDIAEILNSPL